MRPPPLRPGSAACHQPDFVVAQPVEGIHQPVELLVEGGEVPAGGGLLLLVLRVVDPLQPLAEPAAYSSR